MKDVILRAPGQWFYLFSTGLLRRCGMVLFCAASLFLSGCKREEITVYRAPKEEPRRASSAASAAPPMSGHAALPERPTWKLPAGWTEHPADGPSLASFEVKSADGGHAEVSIMPFGVSLDDASLVNISRENLGLTRLSEEEVAKRIQPITVGGLPAKLFDITSGETSETQQLKAGVCLAVLPRDKTTWFFKLQGEPLAVNAEKGSFVKFLESIEFQAAPPMSAGAGSMSLSGGSSGAVLPAWEIPSHWQASSHSDMLLAKFVVTGQNSARTEMTVSSLSGTGGGALMNINRWRGQLGLAPVEEGEANQLLQPLDLPAGKAMLVDMNGTDAKTQKPARMLAVILPRGGETWFYKLMGDPQMTETERPAFLKFLQSLRYAEKPANG